MSSYWNLGEPSDFAWQPRDDYGSTIEADGWFLPYEQHEEWADTLPFSLPVERSSTATAMKKPVAYVSGPYRDRRGTWYVEQNIRKAEAVAADLWLMGYAVICPHTNTKHMDGLIDSETFIDGDIEIVERCDVVIMLPDWHKSEGATRERAAAIEAKVTVLSWLMDRALIESIGKNGYQRLPSYDRS